MEVDLALLADAATIDSAGKLNILGIFDRLTALSFPAQHPQMVLILRFSADVSEIGAHEVQISLKDPEGQEVVRIDGEMRLHPGPASIASGVKLPHVLNLDGMVFPRPGRYAFDVIVDGQHHESVPLHVAGLAHAEA